MSTTDPSSTTRRPATTTSAPLPRSTRQAVVSMAVGLVLTLIALVAPVVDQLTSDGLTAHLREVYAGTGAQAPPASAIAAYLVVVGVLGALGWLLTIAAIRRRRRWARPVATLLAAVGTALAVVDLTVSEYGTGTIVPTWLGVLGLLPCLAGIVAVVLLWTRGDRRSTTRRVV